MRSPHSFRCLLAGFDTVQAAYYLRAAEVAQGNSERAAALVESSRLRQDDIDRVVEDLHKAGFSARVEGMPHCDWVLIDAGDVIVHVFRPEVRTFYNLEKMWAGRAAIRRAS